MLLTCPQKGGQAEHSCSVWHCTHFSKDELSKAWSIAGHWVRRHSDTFPEALGWSLHCGICAPSGGPWVALQAPSRLLPHDELIHRNPLWAFKFCWQRSLGCKRGQRRPGVLTAGYSMCQGVLEMGTAIFPLGLPSCDIQ
jgi:hypothetical protein